MPGLVSRQKDFLPALLVYLFTLIITLVFTQGWFFTIAPIQQLELKMIDDRFQKRGKIDLGDSAKVIILEITQDSYDQIPPPYNQWPWPRSIFAHVIKNLTNAGVKAIGIDIVMSSQDKFDVANDKILKDEIRKSGKVVVAGKVDETVEQQIVSGETYQQKIYENFSSLFFDADSSIGIVKTPADNDGVFRRYLPYAFVSSVNKSVPSFGYAILNKFYNLKNDYTAKRFEGKFVLDKKLIPRFDNHSVLINFYGPNGTFPRKKLIDVLDDKEFKTIDEIELNTEINTWDIEDGGLLSSGIFKDKIVLIGSTMPEDKDIFPVSFSEGNQVGDNEIYGVELHANAIQNVLTNDFLEKQSRTQEIILIIVLSAIAFWGTTYVRKIKSRSGFLFEALNAVIVLGLIASVYFIGIYFFIHSKIVTAVVSPMLGIILAYFGGTAFHFIKERQKNVLIKGMFSQFVSTHIVNSLLNNPDQLKLGGEKKNITILFSDMAGFTSFSENKTPEELVAFINGLLHELTELIINHDGTLDKYLGDAVMAFWGAPLIQEDHAYTACLTSILMQKKVKEISKEWTAKGEKPLNIRIGLNSGDGIVGMVGGEKHKNYTVMGDSVNLASRLEGANKEYQSEIMISESTYEMAKDKILVRELDSIRVKGKSKPTKVFELIGIIGDSEAESKLALFDDYNNALICYKKKEFEKAAEMFRTSFEKTADFTSKVYLERCETYIANPPDESWDGVFVMKTK